MSAAETAAKPAKIGRNDPCPCGSGKKFKHCCEGRQSASLVSPAAGLRSRLKALFDEAQRLWKTGRWAEAVPFFEEIARLDPNSPQAHHDLGMALLQCGRLRAAVASLQKAVTLRPGYESALRWLVIALEPQGREAELLAACRKLGQTASDPAERRFYAAKAMIKEGRRDEAEIELRRLRAVTSQNPEVSLELGRLLADHGRFAEAEALFVQAIDGAIGAFQSLTAIKQISEADQPLLDRMEAELGRDDLEALARASVHFGLGKAYDDLGEFSAAIRHYDEGNRIRALSSRLDRKATAAEVDGAVRAFSASALEGAARALARPRGADEELPVLIVGMPRSGTTLLEQILSAHPAAAAGGELSFWKERLFGWRTSGGGCAAQIKSDAMFRAADEYFALLRKIGPQALRVTDKAPRNFELLWLPRLALPEARIIHCRRHPIDTCLSIYFTNFLASQEFSWDRSDLVFYYRQYQRLMDHWRSVLPPDRFIEVDYELLVSNPEAETRRLIAFLGLEWDDACLAPERNERIVNTASLWQARQPVYTTSVERWRRYEPWLREFSELLPRGGETPEPATA